MKKILFLSHFYYPEIGAASIRMQSFVNTLTKLDYEVKVIAPKPNYPQGKGYLGYERLFIKKNNIAYLPIFFIGSTSIVGRLFSYLSYFFSSLLYTLFSNYKPQIIISSSPPIFTAFGGLIVSKLKGAKFVLDIRDVWPDIGVQLGIINSRLGLLTLKKIEKLLLSNSDIIIVTTSGDKENLISKGVEPERIKIIFNGADTSIFQPADQEHKNEIRNKAGLPIDKKIFTYFGSFNFGMNDIEILGDILTELKSVKDEFHFISIGDGSQKKEFLAKIKDEINFTDFPSLSMGEVSEIVSACDFSVIPRKKINLDTGGNVPVKCYESLATGIPFVLSVNKDDESSKIFANKGFAKLIPAGEEDALRNAILTFLEIDNLHNLGLEGNRFVSEHYSRPKQSQKLVNIIMEFDKKNE